MLSKTILTISLKAGELGWAERAKKVVARFCDLTDFIVNKLGVTDVGAYLPGKAVYHPSCSLTRKLGIVDEPNRSLERCKRVRSYSYS